MLSRLKNGKDDLETAENEIMSLSLVGHKDSLVNGHDTENVVIMVSFLSSNLENIFVRFLQFDF